MTKQLLFRFLLFFMPLAVFSQTFTQGNFTYKVTTGREVSVGSTSKTISTATIPASVVNAGITYTVSSIKDEGFSQCTRLTSVTIPNSITSIGVASFLFCTALTTVSLPNSITSIGMNAFSASGLKSIVIPNSMTSIPERMFVECTALTSVTVPNSIVSIGENTFGNCTSLSSIDIPSSVKTINDYAFFGCTGLTSMTIPDSVSDIGLATFSGCTGLTSITIPNSVISIGDFAFDGCSNLTAVIAQNPTPVTISANVFNGVTISNIPLTVPVGSEASYKAANVWKNFKLIATLSTSLFEKNNKIAAYPNPSTGIFNIQTQENTNVEVFDALGRKIKSQKNIVETSQLDLSEFNSGIYLLKTANGGITKLIKK